MGIFEEQVEERREYDDIALESAFAKMSDAVTGRKDFAFKYENELTTDNAIESVLRYFHIKDKITLDKQNGVDEALEKALSPYGIMRRRVRLTKGWYEDAVGPFLASLKEDGRIVALIPGHPRGYKYYDILSGKNVTINKNNEHLFNEDAYSFYRQFPLKKMNVTDLYKYIFAQITPEDIVRVLIIYGLATALGCLTPKFSQMLYGTVATSGSMQLLISFGVFMITTTITSTIVSSLRSFMMDRLSLKISTNVEAATMMRILSLPPSFFRGHTSGELSQLTKYTEQLCSQLVSLLLSNTLNSVFSLVYIGQIFAYAPSIVVPSLLVLLVSTSFSTVCTLAYMKRSKISMKLSNNVNSVSLSLLNGVEKIKLSGAEKRAFAKWADTYSEYADINYNPPLFLKVNTVIGTIIASIGTIVMYYISIKTGVAVAEYAAFNAAFGMVSGAFNGMSSTIREVSDIKPSIEMCKPILDAVPEVSENKETVSSVRGDVTIDHVSFKYGDNLPYIFKDFSLKIKNGEYVAIVGKTGCGKSTLVRLLLGFEQPESGAIYIDGHDLRSVDIKSIRRHIGTVIQDGKIFQGDIFSNIVVAAPRATVEDAWEAARLAGIDEDIRQMPMQMDTMIADGQGGVSGGQKQRILIARALAPKPKMLIFDEATSALDNITQKQVADALAGLKCTRLVIAHRLSTIKDCDRIIVIDNGSIIEEGTYDELIQANGYFKELVKRQMVE